MIVAKILKFVPICTQFCGAVTTAGELPVLTPVEHTFLKGEFVAFEGGPVQQWKGHAVRGSVKALADVMPTEELALYFPVVGTEITVTAQAEDDWGLR